MDFSPQRLQTLYNYSKCFAKLIFYIYAANVCEELTAAALMMMKNEMSKARICD